MSSVRGSGRVDQWWHLSCSLLGSMSKIVKLSSFNLILRFFLKWLLWLLLEYVILIRNHLRRWIVSFYGFCQNENKARTDLLLTLGWNKVFSIVVLPPDDTNVELEPLLNDLPWNMPVFCPPDDEDMEEDADGLVSRLLCWYCWGEVKEDNVPDDVPEDVMEQLEWGLRELLLLLFKLLLLLLFIPKL